MKRTLANRWVAALVVAFSIVDALILRSNPFGEGTIPWAGAGAVALIGNAVLAYVVASWSAPFLASSGGASGASEASPRAVAIVERGMAAALMTIGAASLLAVDFTTRDLVITPTQRTQRNAELVRETVLAHAPADYRARLAAADTWKLSETTLRSCVPSASNKRWAWCVLVRGDEDSLRVVSYGFGYSNAEQFLRWHPEYRGKRKAD